MGIEGCLLAAGRSCKPKGPCSCVRVLRISKHVGFRALRYVKNPSKGSKEEFGFGVLMQPNTTSIGDSTVELMLASAPGSASPTQTSSASQARRQISFSDLPGCVPTKSLNHAFENASGKVRDPSPARSATQAGSSQRTVGGGGSGLLPNI